MVQTLAQTRLETQGLATGRRGSAAELGILVSQIRRTISTTAVRAQAECLLTWLSNLGPGSRMAAKRREWARREEQQMLAERAAVWLADIRQRGVHRRGQFLRP